MVKINIGKIDFKRKQWKYFKKKKNYYFYPIIVVTSVHKFPTLILTITCDYGKTENFNQL